MSKCLITGSGGLVGSEAVKYFANHFDQVIGIDNDQREIFFGASVKSQIEKNKEIPNYIHWGMDIRDMGRLFVMPHDVKLVIHCAAQPSHDWATKDILTDFEINTTATIQLMELVREYCPDAVVCFASTNKVMGDYPNGLEYAEEEKRFGTPNKPSKFIDLRHLRMVGEMTEADRVKMEEELLQALELSTKVDPPFKNGFDETTPIDNVKHSFFGCSKAAADLYVQEYGKYFGMKTGVFRCGCITGSNHAGAKLHGFLAYLVKCAKEDIPYTVIGFQGRQVRDIIHAHDLVTAFHQFYLNPKQGEVYNMGGGTHSNCSVLEAIEMVENITGKKMHISFEETPRVGDHKWWISDVRKFQSHFPDWKYKYTLEKIINEMCK